MNDTGNLYAPVAVVPTRVDVPVTFSDTNAAWFVDDLKVSIHLSDEVESSRYASKVLRFCPPTSNTSMIISVTDPKDALLNLTFPAVGSTEVSVDDASKLYTKLLYVLNGK